MRNDYRTSFVWDLIRYYCSCNSSSCSAILRVVQWTPIAIIAVTTTARTTKAPSIPHQQYIGNLNESAHPNWPLALRYPNCGLECPKLVLLGFRVQGLGWKALEQKSHFSHSLPTHLCGSLAATGTPQVSHHPIPSPGLLHPF